MVHPQAHILKAIADGEPVQAKYPSDSDWWDFNTKHMDGIYVPVQRIDASMIEVEE